MLTDQEIRDLLAERDITHGPMHAAMLSDQDVIFASDNWQKSIVPSYLKGFPAGFRMSIPPIAKKGVELAVNATMIGEIPGVQYSLIEEEPSEERERKRKLTEDLYKALARNIAERTTVNPARELLEKQHGLGGGALTFPFRWDLWREMQALAESDPEAYALKSRDAWYWDTYVTHPCNIYLDTESDPPESFIIKDKITNRAARQLYPDAADRTAPDDKGQVERIIYISQTEYHVSIGGVEVVAGENPCNMLWYEWAWGGYGTMDEDRRLEHIGKGIIRDAKDVIAMIVKAINRNEAISDVAAFTPRGVITKTIRRSHQLAESVEFGPNKFVPMLEGESLDPLKQNEVPATSAWTLDTQKVWLELILGNEILTGSAPTQPASEYRQRVGLAQSHTLAAKVASEQAYGNMLRKMVGFIKHELGTSKYGVSLGKNGPFMDVNVDDILEDGILQIDYTPPTKEDRAAEQVRDAADLQAAVIDKEEYRRRQDIQGGPEMDRRNRVEQLRNHPSIIEAKAMVARQRMLERIAPELAAQEQGVAPAGQAAATQQFSSNGAGGNGGIPMDNRMPTGPQATQQDARALFAPPQPVAAGP